MTTLPVGQGIAPASGFVPAGFATVLSRGDDQRVQFSAGPYDVPVSFAVGTVIQGFGVALIDTTTSTVKVELVSSTTGTIGSIVSQGTGTEQLWTSSFATSHTMAAGEMLWFRCSPIANGGGYASVMSTLESFSVWTAPSPACADTATAGQIYQCEANAQSQCTNLGFGSNDYCFQALAQSCSCRDRLTAQATCAHHPEIAHNIGTDGSCSLVWR